MSTQKKLEDMTAVELEAHIEKANKLKEEKKKHETNIKNAREKIDAILSDLNMKIEDIYPEKFKTDKKSNTTRKRTFYYRNPDNHDQIYKRSGAKPDWVDAAIQRHGEDACKIPAN